MNDKFHGMIGLCKRAGKLITGEYLSSKAVKSGKSKLVIIACDASDNPKKSMINSCNYYKVKYVTVSDKESLGRATGSDSRAVISVNDDNFAKAILDRLN